MAESDSDPELSEAKHMLIPHPCFLGLQKGLGHRAPGRSWPSEAGLYSQTLGNVPKPVAAGLPRLKSAVPVSAVE